MDAEIFATGTWGGRTWTESDLDTMAANFARLAAHVKPPLKLGHDSKQILAQRDGQPALGWVSGLKRVGSKLVAEFADVPNVIRDLIEKRRFRRVSSEIYPAWHGTSWEKTLQTGVAGPVLSAVALLGADAPEVKTLEDLGRVLATEGIAPVTFSAVEPADGAQTLEVEDDGKPSLTAQAIADAVVTLLSQRAAHPRTIGHTPEGVVEDTGMTDADKSALMAEMAMQMDERVAAATKPLTEQIAKLSEAKAQAETQLAKVAEDNARLAAEASRAAANALRVEAERFTETRCTKQNLRLFPTQKPAARALYERLNGTDPIVSADEATAYGLKQAMAYTARELFAEFVDMHPHAPILAEQSHRTDTPTEDTLDTALAAVAKERGLDLTKYDERQTALGLVAKAKPTLVPDYRSTAAHAA